MSKMMRYLIPMLTIVLFSIVMNAGGLLKKSYSANDNVPQSIEILKKDVMKEDWKNAETDLEKLKTAWLTIEKRLQFSMVLDELNMIDTSIARIEGAIEVKDKSFIIIELSEIVKHWNRLEK